MVLVSGEAGATMTHDSAIVIAAVTILLGALGYFIKFWFGRVSNKLDIMTEQRTECRETLSTRFADKVETQYNIGRLVDKTESLDNRVSLIEGSIRRQ